MLARRAPLVIATLATVAAHAAEDCRSIATISASASLASFTTTTAPSLTSCPDGKVHIRLEPIGGRAMLSILLSAKASGKPIRFVYALDDALGVCTAELIEMQT